MPTVGFHCTDIFLHRNCKPQQDLFSTKNHTASKTLSVEFAHFPIFSLPSSAPLPYPFKRYFMGDATQMLRALSSFDWESRKAESPYTTIHGVTPVSCAPFHVFWCFQNFAFLIFFFFLCTTLSKLTGQRRWARFSGVLKAAQARFEIRSESGVRPDRLSLMNTSGHMGVPLLPLISPSYTSV